MENIVIGSDHAGVKLKAEIIRLLESMDYKVEDKGTYTEDSCDYPKYAHAVANAVNKGNFNVGILICGSANGVCMTANKHQNVRAAISWTAEIAELARLHNDANIVCLPARYISLETATSIVKTFLSTDFEGGRHGRRVNKISI